jgi:hypothetical protein
VSTKLSTKNLEGKITSKQAKETSNPKPLNQIDKVVQLKKKDECDSKSSVVSHDHSFDNGLPDLQPCRLWILLDVLGE